MFDFTSAEEKISKQSHVLEINTFVLEAFLGEKNGYSFRLFTSVYSSSLIGIWAIARKQRAPEHDNTMWFVGNVQPAELRWVHGRVRATGSSSVRAWNNIPRRGCSLCSLRKLLTPPPLPPHPKSKYTQNSVKLRAFTYGQCCVHDDFDQLFVLADA